METNWQNRIASEDIDPKETAPNEVFTYGDNLAHRHGKGAAKTALKFGAKHGQGGHVGNSYGIPTKDRTIKRTLSIAEIKVYVDRFIEYAKDHPELIFLVTQIGCGLAGRPHKEIAPLFKEAIYVQNIHLPEKFWRFLVDTNETV